MSYLKLRSGRRNIIYSSPNSDKLVLGQIIGSQSSYESPKKIRNIQELNKWFGSEYPDYQYHCKLLRSGITLALYKPVSASKRQDIDSYIDYSEYFINESTIYTDPSEIPVPSDRQIYQVSSDLLSYIWDGTKFIQVPEDYGGYQISNTVYQSLSEIPLSETDLKKTLHRVTSESGELKLYIWLDDILDYIDTDYLPQNTGDLGMSESWNNRDTLDLMSIGSKLTVGHRRYSEADEVIPEGTKSEGVLATYNENKLEGGSHTYAIKFNFDGVTGFGDSDYITLCCGLGSYRILLYFTEFPDNLPSEDYVSQDHRFYIQGDTRDETIENFWEFLENYKFDGDTVGFGRIGDTLWSSYMMPLDYFYRLPGLSIESEDRLSWDIVSSAYLGNYRIRFTSKTIGRHETPIKITIQKFSRRSDEYQVLVSRGGEAEEVHVGKLFPSPSDDNYYSGSYLEYIINSNSDLVRVKINQYRTDPESGKPVRWENLVPDYEVTTGSGRNSGVTYNTTTNTYYVDGQEVPNPFLPEGTWELRGSVVESQDGDNYMKSLDILEESDMSMDLFLVPRISDFIKTRSSDLSWFPEYEVILEFCKSKKIQALISNNDIGEEVPELPEKPRKGWVYYIKSPRFIKWTGRAWTTLTEEPEDYTESYVIPENPVRGETYKIPGNYYKYSGNQWETIENKAECNPYLNEFYWNYVQTTSEDLRNPVDLDPYNYLVYFYRGFTDLSDGTECPGYHSFLVSVSSDFEVLKRSDYMYSSPVEDPLDFETDVPLEVSLESKKSNYMVTDGFGYYYKRLFNHTGDYNYKTSILSRYFQNKLSREFEGIKWNIINQRIEARMLEEVNNLLASVSGSSTFIYSAELEEYYIDREEQTAYFSVVIRTKELTDRDINLDITLNFTK